MPAADRIDPADRFERGGADDFIAMPHNELFIHTDRGSYTGGEWVIGTVFLSIHHPVPARALVFEIVGYENAEWVEHRTESYTASDGTQKSRQVEEQRHAHRDFFRDSLPLISYPGGFPTGMFSYPFQYRLPDDLPGVFYATQGGHERFKAKIQYKVKALLDLGHGHHLKCKQHLFVNGKLDLAIAPKHVSKHKTVRTCCCFSRGNVNCEAWMDKNAYMAGERCQVHVEVDNESTVEMRHFSTKLLKYIRLRDAHGHTKQIRSVVAIAKYAGCDPKSKKTTDCPLDLVSCGRGHGDNSIQPSTSSKYVSCEYSIQIELDIPWAPDLDIFVPTTIYAPQDSVWSAWQPPTWAAQAVQQEVASQLAVPQDYLQTHMTNGYFHDASAPTVEMSANFAAGGAQASYSASATERSPIPRSMDTDPTRPLLG